MIRRLPDDRKAKSDIHGIFEMKRLDRDQRLVMVHAQSRVVIGTGTQVEHGIRRVRATDAPALCRKSRDCRLDDVEFLAAELTALAGVRVETRNGKPRIRY